LKPDGHKKRSLAMPLTAIAVAHDRARPASALLSLLRRLQHGATDLLLHLAAAERERRERRQMAELCDATLRDLGLTRADLWAELEKPVWRR
jgi:uncharacterized protein YjiS (DUF1127 family)